MSEPHDFASADTVDIDIRKWVDAARADPQLHRDRQVTEIVLAAIGLSRSLHQSLVLKGGTLMAIAFGSERVTSDVDFTAVIKPEGFEDMLRSELDGRFEEAAIKLGYLDILCAVQGVRKLPRPEIFEDATFPALEIRIGSAIRGSTQEAALAQGRASRILYIEISFRDQVYAFQELHLSQADVAVQAFTLEELIAEKFRALLQQPIRKRNRRQDIFDIAFLIESNELDVSARARILETLIEKCRTRGIYPDIHSIDDEEVRSRAEKEWQTLRLEVSDLRPFAEQFEKVRSLYRGLPWSLIRE